MTVLDQIDSSQALRIAPDVRIRREHFGGLVFRAADMAVYETDDLTYRLLGAVDGSRSLAAIIQFGVCELGGSRDIVERVLRDMVEAGVLAV